MTRRSRTLVAAGCVAALATIALACSPIADGAHNGSIPGSPSVIAGEIAPAAVERASGPATPKPPRVARTTAIPDCTVHVDAAAGPGSGTAAAPFDTIGRAVDAARAGAVICVAEGDYPESLAPGAKPLTLAGGFRSGSGFSVRDSARYVSRAIGDGTGSFVRIEDPAPSGRQLTAVDGFEITGYSQAIYRRTYYSQRFDITNNFIHDNTCTEEFLIGAGFSLSAVSGTIRGNVLEHNDCWRGGAGAIDDPTDENRVTIVRNRIVGNAGTEDAIAHGGALYLFANRLTITGNLFSSNTTTGWGAGLFVGAFTAGGQHTTANLRWNTYERNEAGIAGGGFFCDDGARCISRNEIYVANCGGNIYVDGGPDGSGPTVATFDQLTNVGARSVGCRGSGTGLQIDSATDAADRYSVTNAIFWGNAPRRDIATACSASCNGVRITVTYSMVDRRTSGGAIPVQFGAGIMAPRDPRFVAVSSGDLHLRSVFGHWTRAGYVADRTSSPALAKGDPASPTPLNPPRAGDRTELGAYGNSPEASHVE